MYKKGTVVRFIGDANVRFWKLEPVMLEDSVLLWRLRRGDAEALRVLYDKYKGSLRTMAASMLGSRGDGEDVLQDVFVSFAENVGNIRIRTSLKSYLAACIVNQVRDEFRRKRPGQFEPGIVESLQSERQCPAGAAETAERWRLLTEGLCKIPYEQREVIVLHLQGGLKFRQIAVIQQTSVSTVHGRYRYGLKKLRTILNGELER